ncbi:hypothetical protein [Catenuloplanes atrovinosus]|uniref:ABC transporter n=1 Tax=Catenuloplanes atrovinosus TaxID=137266 RepID=A0AAE3YQB5_9ACTN|nr:hypothetical protein [Catenuloplanes atrovinosus]MDR7278033.1 hypothetical protein [Catenuloplanes atrovinosus]
MIALVRYSLSMLVRSQGYIAPILLHGTAVTVLTTGDAGPLAETYSACALTLFLSMTWLTVVLINTEDRTQRAMTATAAGGETRVLAGNVLAAASIAVLLMLVGLIYPLYAGRHPITGAGLAVGVIAQLTAGFAGIAVGLLCSRLLIRRTGVAVLVAVGAVGVMVLIRVIPPVAPMLVLLGSEAAPETMLTPLSGLGAVSVLMVAAAAATVHHVGRRQE